MIIIVGEIVLLTLPFCIYAICKSTPIKKHTFIICETIAVAVLLFCSTLVALDIPYIIKGGEKCEEQITYTYATQSKGFNIARVGTSDGKVYWALDDDKRYETPLWINVLKYGNKGDADLYVLPHTRLVYRVENTFNSMKDTELFQFINQYANEELYTIYSMNSSILVLLVIEGFMLWAILRYRTGKSL